MSRLSIEIPEHQHQQIKAMAALHGISIKDYILDRTLPATQSNSSEADDLARLEGFLAPRIAAAERGEFDNSTMEEIIAEAHSQHRAN